MARTPFDIIRERMARHQSAHQVHYRAAPHGSVVSYAHPEHERPLRKPTALERLINAWWNRLLSSVYKGSLSDQPEEYEAGSTVRDYLWNTVGTSLWGFSFPLLTIVATQLTGADGAGRFSIAFVTGTLLMIAAGYGVRTFQVSDLEETHSFASYQLNRWITGILALVIGLIYATLRGYDAGMFTLCAGVFIYKALDGIADVYEGRLQQADKLYLAGISQTVRSLGAVVAFSVVLFITRSLEVASVAMALAAAASFILLTVPLALLETEKSRKANISEVLDLLSRCFPLFGALFLFNLIESMPKYVMEGALAYDNQLYFNALYFPAQGILLGVGFIYKPQLLRLAAIWSNPRRRKRFDLIVAAVMGIAVLFTILAGLFMSGPGLTLMSFMYGLDFERFHVLALLMVAAGGITAIIDFLYAVITVLRRQHEVTRLYLIAFAGSVVLPLILVNVLGLTGAVISYLSVMTLLLVLLIGQYLQMRRAITREYDPFAP